MRSATFNGPPQKSKLTTEGQRMGSTSVEPYPSNGTERGIATPFIWRLLSIGCCALGVSASINASVSAEDHAFLEAQFAARAVPNASIWSEEYEYDEAHPCYLTLPSLNSPGGRVSVRWGVCCDPESSPLIERGILPGLIETPLALNCSKEELCLINSFVSDYRSGNGPSGLRFHGCNFVRCDNRIEGRLLAMAARLRCSNLETRLLLAAQVAALLSAG